MRASDISRMLRGKRIKPGQYLAKCPAHPDKKPSLSIREGRKCVLLKCWPGCTVEEIVFSMGLKMSDLWHSKSYYVAPEISQRIKDEHKLEEIEYAYGLAILAKFVEPNRMYWDAVEHSLATDRKELIFKLYPLRKAAYDLQIKIAAIGWDRMWDEFWSLNPVLDKANPIIIPDQKLLF